MALQSPPLSVPRFLSLSSLAVTQPPAAVWAVTSPSDIGYVASWLEQVYTDFTIKWQHTLGFLPAQRHEKPVPLKFLLRLMGSSLTQHPATIAISRLFLAVRVCSTIATIKSHRKVPNRGDKWLSLLCFFSKIKDNFSWSSTGIQALAKQHLRPTACFLGKNRCKEWSNIPKKPPQKGKENHRS